jgi:hypothetical protein
MKIILLAMLLSVAQASAPIPRKAPDAATSDGHQTKNQTNGSQKPANSPPEIAGKKQPPTTDDHTNGQDNTNGEQPIKVSELPTVSVRGSEFNWQGLIANVLLFVVGGLQIWILLGTLKVTGKAADAAKLSAEAVLRGERAWLLMTKPGLPRMTPIPDSQDISYSCFIEFKNYGKTPAKIIAINSEIQIGNSKESPDDFSIYSSRIQPVVPEMVPQGEPAPHMADSTTSIRREQTAQLYKTRFFWVCGVVRYEDIFRPEPWHETRFCYLLEDRDNGLGVFWYLAGPSEYNSAT